MGAWEDVVIFALGKVFACNCASVGQVESPSFQSQCQNGAPETDSVNRPTRVNQALNARQRMLAVIEYAGRSCFITGDQPLQSIDILK